MREICVLGPACSQQHARESLHVHRQELNMSGINGDKSRFNRERKQKIARRKRNRQLAMNLEHSKLPGGATAAKAKERLP